MSRALKEQLKHLRQATINPREEWVVSTRVTLLAQIKNTVVPQKPSVFATISSFLSFFFAPQALLRPVAAFLVIAITISSWVATSKASQGSLPGDTLYPLKIAREKTQLAWISMVNDKTKAVQLHVELAGRRTDEVKKIIASPAKKIRAVEAVNSVKQELVAANLKLEDIKQQSNPILSPEVVTSIKQQTDDIKKSLQEVKINLQTSTTTEDKMLSEQVADAKNTAKDTDVATVQVAIADHLKTNSAISKDYVSALIDTTLTHAVEEAGENKSNSKELTTIVDGVVQGLISSPSSSVTTSLKATPSSTVSTSSAEKIMTATVVLPLVSSTEHITSVAASLKGDTAQAALKTELANEELAQKVNEVKQLVSDGNFSQAADKIQEVSEASKEVEKITDATIAKVQNATALIPMVIVVTSTASSSVGISSSSAISSSSVFSHIGGENGSSSSLPTVLFYLEPSTSTAVSTSLRMLSTSIASSSVSNSTEIGSTTKKQ